MGSNEANCVDRVVACCCLYPQREAERPNGILVVIPLDRAERVHFD